MDKQEIFGDWLKVRELADELKCTTRTIQNWKSAGLIPFYRIGGRSVRFKRTEVEAALRARHHHAATLN